MGTDIPGGGLEPVQVPNTCQRLVMTPRGAYLVLVSWPLDWGSDGRPNNPHVGDVPLICIVDGNAYFFTATDVVRRMQFSFGKRAIILGVGYPITDAVFEPHRRAADLTPSATTEGYPTIRGDRSQSKAATLGEASDFHTILETSILPLVERELLPAVPLRRLPKALYGHSFGGLFTLYSLFTRPGLFDTYIAASPSIWWNDCSIVKEQEKDFLAAPPQSGSGSKPCLYLMYGSNEQDVARKPYESDEEYERRQRNASQRRMKSNALELVDRLSSTDKLADVWLQEFEAEDHGSAAICALQRGLIRLLGEKAGTHRR